MRKKQLLMAFVLVFTSLSVMGQHKITIKGKVEFPDNKFKMEVVERRGFDRIVHDSTDVDADGNYEFTLDLERAGVYSLDCQKWQSVQFWGEDEDLEIDFRGQDTARIKIKNPPYVYIKGGPNNELMNLYNFDNHRNYQLMIGVSQNVYRMKDLDDEAKQKHSAEFYNLLSDESNARTRYLADKYSDRNSVMALLPRLGRPDDLELQEDIIERLKARDPNYPPLVEFIKARDEAKAQQELLAIGKPAPEFSFVTPDGKSKLGPQDFKGKIVVLDFWASWCGPCIGEIPNLKKDYEAFADKGVEIISVSIDSKEADWRRAMEQHDMPWVHLHAPNSGKDVMKQYQFSGIPHILVLDREGNIAARNTRGPALTEKLEEMTK